MNALGQSILDALATVAQERARRAVEAGLATRVAAIKAFQHARFERTYEDMLTHARYGDAARFFLEDLYGPHDFTERDQQFARIVPALVRLFPEDIVRTVADLAALHALSERLDSAMGAAHWLEPLTAAGYGDAWCAVGEAVSRERQVVLMVGVGRALDRYTRSTWMRQTLRLMRGPAQAAGLGALQRFLERGFDTFKAMRGAEAFLDLIAQRERGLMAALYAGDFSALQGVSGQAP